jgi:hypothetical protein
MIHSRVGQAMYSTVYDKDTFQLLSPKPDQSLDHSARIVGDKRLFFPHLCPTHLEIRNKKP